MAFQAFTKCQISRSALGELALQVYRYLTEIKQAAHQTICWLATSQ